MVPSRNLWGGSTATHRIAVLDFRGADFSLFRDLPARIPWDSRCVLPFRGTLTGWRNGLTETSWKSTKENTKSCPWGRVIPGTSIHWGPTVWKATLQRRTWWFWQTANRTWARNELLWQKRPKASWAALGRALPRGPGRWFFPSTQHWWDPSGVLGPVLASPVQERYSFTGANPVKGYKDD